MRFKLKIILLSLVFLILSLVGYEFAIKKTIDVYEVFTAYVKNQNELGGLPSEILELKQEKNELNSMIQKKQTANLNQTSSLLLSLNRVLEKHPKVSIKEFKQPLPFEDENITKLVYELNLKGDYKSIVNFIYEIEYEKELIDVLQLKIEKEYNFKYHKNELFSTLLIIPRQNEIH